MANVQISEELFFSLVKYHLLSDQSQSDSIKEALQAKIDKMAERQMYTEYKTALTPEDAEKARQKYLDKKGIPKDFRW